MYDIYCFCLFSFFNLFRLVISCKLAIFFQDSSYCDVCQYLCWEIAILFFDLLIVIGVLVEKIYVKYKNLFHKITLKLTIWSAFNPNRSLDPEQIFLIVEQMVSRLPFRLPRSSNNCRMSFASFLFSPILQGGNEGFFSKNDHSMRKNAEIIWRTRKKISNSPSKTS